MVVRTLRSFRELAVSKLEDDGCSEAASVSAPFWRILFSSPVLR